MRDRTRLPRRCGGGKQPRPVPVAAAADSLVIVDQVAPVGPAARAAIGPPGGHRLGAIATGVVEQHHRGLGAGRPAPDEVGWLVQASRATDGRVLVWPARVPAVGLRDGPVVRPAGQGRLLVRRGGSYT